MREGGPQLLLQVATEVSSQNGRKPGSWVRPHPRPRHWAQERMPRARPHPPVLPPPHTGQPCTGLRSLNLSPVLRRAQPATPLPKEWHTPQVARSPGARRWDVAARETELLLSCEVETRRLLQGADQLPEVGAEEKRGRRARGGSFPGPGEGGRVACRSREAPGHARQAGVLRTRLT